MLYIQPTTKWVTKRENGHLNATQALLFHNNVHVSYLGEVVLITKHLINRLHFRTLGFKSPTKIF